MNKENRSVNTKKNVDFSRLPAQCGDYWRFGEQNEKFIRISEEIFQRLFLAIEKTVFFGPQ